jgi:2-methylcitrate dehydratase PrpD
MILVGDPLERRQDPRTLVDGQFSMPFLAAVMIRQGSFGWSDFEKYLPDADIRRACKTVVPVRH